MATEQYPVHFKAACVIEDDYVFIAAKPDDLDEEQAFTRIFFYDAQQRQMPWRHMDWIDSAVVDVCVSRVSFGGQRRYVALSKQGQVHYSWPQGFETEQIPDAGIDRDTPIYGYLNAIREISGRLYACGGGGQIYVRGNAGWSNLAGALRVAVTAPKPNLALNQIQMGDELGDIDGFSENDLYVVGHGTVRQYDGVQWTACEVPTDEILLAVLCTAEGEVWACGFNGTILRGNASSGFKDVSRFDDNMIFSSMCIYGKLLYLASNEGLFALDMTDRDPRITKIPEITDTDFVGCTGATIWSVGNKDIVYSDGRTWTRIDHPDNPPIR